MYPKPFFMKQQLIALAGFGCMILFSAGFRESILSTAASITGAWQLRQGSTEQVLIFQDGYFSHTVFDKSNKQFTSTYGGIYKTDGNSLKLLIEFDTRSTDRIGNEKTSSHTVGDKRLSNDITGSTAEIG
jgi:hypothetical protein